ncbi:uncharacterized protein LOC102714191 [Oryza brachyantha]|uniref:At1g61320/AtMIF1 LRR domain-containing protein n=1 Tax=Oryza brachyantha TaxID=4533 RepID=J3M994_ORYBR|nr:uncharacterized protein LOC102714191 [Oryza brachyantha]
MGLLSLKRLMSTQREQKRRRRQVQARRCVADGSIASLVKHKGPPYQQQNQGVKIMRNSCPSLPEDIWYLIHSLLPLQDAARTACVSHTFLRSWRCYPNLIFDMETIGLMRGNSLKKRKVRLSVIDHIMKNHSGIGLRTFMVETYRWVNTSYIDRWLQIAITPAIEELTLTLYSKGDNLKYYSFPFSLLSSRGGNSIKHLNLSQCAFHPTAGLNCLISLHLWDVCVTGDELGCLLSSSSSLEQLELGYCKDLNYLKIPCLLERLNDLEVYQCKDLQMMEVKAPNLSHFRYVGDMARLSDGGIIAVKNLDISFYIQHNAIHYVCAKLPSILPTTETLTIKSLREEINTPVAHFRFLHLKCLTIYLNYFWEALSPYDCLSLAYFLDACPVLETFNLTVWQHGRIHDVISEDYSRLRQMPGVRHDKIRNVEIIGFFSAKSMVELACHILKNATSLECLTLDTINDGYKNPDRLSVHKIGCCSPIDEDLIMEAKNALFAIRRYIVGKVPSTVKLDVLKPCSWCHTGR